MVTASQLAEDYPVLFHMAAAGSWPGIQTHGLLSTTALLDLFEITGEQRRCIEEEHRPEEVRIEHPLHGRAVIRDQKPMDGPGLLRALPEGLSPREWHLILNAKVFFWVRRSRLDVMMAARAYRNTPKTVLYLKTEDLLERHAADVLLAPMNTGATKPMPHPRDRNTFLPLGEYPYQELRRKKRQHAVVELAVETSVPQIGELVFRAEHVEPSGVVETLFER
jgi:hypothetical protein